MTAYSQDDPQIPKIGSIIEHSPTESFQVLSQIYAGPFSAVFLVKLLSTSSNDKRYAMKIEKIVSCERPYLRLDVLVLLATAGRQGFPRIAAIGKTEHYKYLIMQLLGPDLGRLRRTQKERHFSLSTALRILVQTLDRIKSLHESGYISRDVKAPNFTIGLKDEANVIFMLDYGFARKYVDENGEVIAPRPSAALMGTFQYCPLSAHGHKDQSRKDDLESWLYFAIEIIKGPLPWAKIDGRKDHKKILDYKMNVRQGHARIEFFRDVPTQFSTILDKIDAMGYYDEPQYEVIRELIHEAASEHGITLKEPFDWQTNDRMLRKVEHVGELGESNLASTRLEDQELKLQCGQNMLEVEIDVTPPEDEGPSSSVMTALLISPARSTSTILASPTSPTNNSLTRNKPKCVSSKEMMTMYGPDSMNS